MERVKEEQEEKKQKEREQAENDLKDDVLRATLRQTARVPDDGAAGAGTDGVD